MLRNIKNTAKMMCCGALLVTLFTGCYRMPTDDDYSLIPTTNNPDITREGGAGCGMPNGGF